MKSRNIGGVPMDPAIASSGENGEPIVRSSPGSTLAEAFTAVADELVAVLQV